MKILLLGATGNFGSRLLPALQAHGHDVVAYIRSEAKLKDLIPSSILSRATIIVGDATDSNAIREALTRNRCDALINSAGQASLFPWQAPTLQGIEQAVITAAMEASKEMGRPLRTWFLGGMTALDYPGFKGTRLKRYVPVFPEHLHTLAKLQAQSIEHLQWSLFCPSTMLPASETIQPLTTPRGNPLIGAKDIPAAFRDLYISWIPYVGPWLTAIVNAPRYNTRLEDCADFIAADLKEGNKAYVGHRVGVYDTGKKQT